MVFDVVEIVLKFFGGIFNCCVVVVVDLGLFSDVWFDVMLNGIKWDFFGQLIDEKRVFGMWIDKVYIVFENVE